MNRTMIEYMDGTVVKNEWHHAHTIRAIENGEPGTEFIMLVYSLMTIKPTLVWEKEAPAE